jgi:hypothetical protein
MKQRIFSSNTSSQWIIHIVITVIYKIASYHSLGLLVILAYSFYYFKMTSNNISNKCLRTSLIYLKKAILFEIDRSTSCFDIQ